MDEAELMCRRALKGREREHGASHRNTLNSRGNLGLVLMKHDDESSKRMVRDALLSLLSPPHSLPEAHAWIKKFRPALEL